MLSLTLDEERSRVFETWLDWDWKLSQMCSGPLDWLKTQVMDPAGFRQNGKQLVFAFSDQVPFLGCCYGDQAVVRLVGIKEEGRQGGYKFGRGLVEASRFLEPDHERW